jgi:hypothetical protein
VDNGLAFIQITHVCSSRIGVYGLEMYAQISPPDCCSSFGAIEEEGLHLRGRRETQSVWGSAGHYSIGSTVPGDVELEQVGYTMREADQSFGRDFLHTNTHTHPTSRECAS